MSLDSIYRFFNKIRNKVSYDKTELITAFKTFWDSAPSEEEFGRIMIDIPVLPEMIYYMTQNPIGKGGCKCSKPA